VANILNGIPRTLVLERRTQEQNLSLAISAWHSPNLTLETHGTRTQSLTEDGLKLLLCHEIGHIAGGEPTRNFFYNDIPFSEEGEADYYSTSGCLPAVFSQQENSKFLEFLNLSTDLQEICRNEVDDVARALCARVALASLNASRFLYKTWDTHFMGVDPGVEPNLKNKAGPERIVGTMNYPLPQCRLDTFLKGFECRSVEQPVSYTKNPNVGTRCGKSASNVSRPSCWYGP